MDRSTNRFLLELLQCKDADEFGDGGRTPASAEQHGIQVAGVCAPSDDASEARGFVDVIGLSLSVAEC